ncbi:MAG: DinB family protein [Phycisphaerales bacterium]
MESLRIYDYLTSARQKVFDSVRPLSVEQYASVFPIGLGTLGRTLTHIMICEWFYMQRIEERVVPPYDQWPIQDEKPPPFPVLESTWIEQAKQTRASLAAVGDWDAVIEYRTLSDDENDPPKIVTASAADLFTQLALHEVHHRAQALNILRQLGVAIEELDFNALMYARREAVAG